MVMRYGSPRRPGGLLMNRKAVVAVVAAIAAVALITLAPFPAIGQQNSTSTSAPAVFTAAQAQAGRVVYEGACGKCHTETVMGRKGDPGELPPVSSLPAFYQKFIGTKQRQYPSGDIVWQGLVPPLAGNVFIGRWGDKTAGQLIARFQETVDDKDFGFEGVNDEFTVNLTAYILQVNGARAGTVPLSRTTAAIVSSLTR
jgi:cytochrome c553